MISEDVEILRRLKYENRLVPLQIRDDDHVVITKAIRKDGFILSNDGFADHIRRYPDRRAFLENHCIKFGFALEEFMPDPGNDFIELINGIRRQN